MNTRSIKNDFYRYAGVLPASALILALGAAVALGAAALEARAEQRVEIRDTSSPIRSTLASPARATQIGVGSSEVFGRSVQGRALWAHVLGGGENVTMIFAAVHGNETATPYLVHELRAHLKRHPEILQNRRVILVPALNPDGLQARRRYNARGVDINRNYPGTWRRPRRGESFRPGVRAASEPETQAMMRLVGKYRPDKIVSIHQPLHCLAYSGERSRELARVIAQHNGYRIKSNIGYPTPGGFGGYCETIIETPVVTLELPWQNPQAAWKRNAKSLLAAIALSVAD